MNEADTNSTVPQTCLQCGAPLPAGALAGLCPACLLKQGAAADTATRPEAPPFVPPTVAEVDRVFPQLEIMALLGKGGMGAVYKARQPALERIVALKILPAQAGPDSGFSERFTREAPALARFSHPNIVAMHEFGQVSQSSAGVSPASAESGAGGTSALPYFIGHSKEDAEDLTQGFFASFLKRNYLEGVSSEKGKFRAFLLTAFKYFFANEWDRAKRKKRGGGVAPLSLDWQDADARYQIAPADQLSPDRLYDRAWATTLLEQVIARLREECAAEGKGKLFEQLKPFLMMGKSDIPYAQAAGRLGLNEGTARVAVHRLRKRYRGLLREEIVQTLADPTQVEEEMRALLEAFSG